MGDTEAEIKGSELATSLSVQSELCDTSGAMNKQPMTESVSAEDCTLQGARLPIQLERSSDLLNGKPCTLPKNMEFSVKDLSSSFTGESAIVSALYCNETGDFTTSGLSVSSDISTLNGSHSYEMKPPMVNVEEYHKHSSWVPRNPQNYKIRNIEPAKETTTQAPVRVVRPPAEGRSKSQLMPRYWPRGTDQDQLLMLKNTNSTITPLFEKVLSASDTGKVGRLVLPKACAEVYFPPISQAEGLPLHIQDVSGNEWVFQFRFWPNNNSRMYVLEGITPCIQSMQLQAGDTVIFSRLEPEGKLVMGYRKTPHIPNTEETKKDMVVTVASSGSTDKVSMVASFTGSKKKETSRLDSSLTSDKRKGKDAGSKNKKIKFDSERVEFKKNWEMAQSLLEPPPNIDPTIVTIEGYEFEEYKDPPVFGRQLTISSAVRTCVSNQRQHGESNNVLSQNIKVGKQDGIEPLQGSEPMSGLEALATLATVEKTGTTVSSSSPATTTKHPRHRPGCSCIVCIQPPSGKGPKHEPDCGCNVCMSVKRRFQTLMLRRKKEQAERAAGTAAQKKRFTVKEESNTGVIKLNEPTFGRVGSWKGAITQSISGALPKMSEKHSKGNGLSLGFSLVGSTVKVEERDHQLLSKGPHFDLNRQPEKEDELNRAQSGSSMKSLLKCASYPLDIYLKQQGLISLVCNKPIHLSLENSLVDKKAAEQAENPSSVLLNDSKVFAGETQS